MRGIIFLAMGIALLSVSGCSPPNIPPILSASQHQYCAILDQYWKNMVANDAADTSNDLQVEAEKKADQQLFENLYAALGSLFATQNVLDNWVVKFEPGVSIVDDGMVKVELEIACGDYNDTRFHTKLITVVSRKDDNLISLLASEKTGSYATVSGTFRQIGHRETFSDWDSGLPMYITFLLSDMTATDESGATSAEIKSTHSVDSAMVRALDSAASEEFEKDEEHRIQNEENSFQDFMRRQGG